MQLLLVHKKEGSQRAEVASTALTKINQIPDTVILRLFSLKIFNFQSVEQATYEFYFCLMTMGQDLNTFSR